MSRTTSFLSTIVVGLLLSQPLAAVATTAPEAVAPPPAPGQAAASSVAPAQDPLVAVTALSHSLSADLEAVLKVWQGLQPKVTRLAVTDARLKPAAIDFPMLRSGLQACFATPNNGPCDAPPVAELRRYANALELPLRGLVTAKLAEVDELRNELSDVAVRSRLLAEQAGRARQEVERLTQEAFLQVQDVDENPLESATVKTRKLDEYKRVQQERKKVIEAAARVEREAKPLESKVASARARVLDDLTLLGAGAPSR